MCLLASIVVAGGIHVPVPPGCPLGTGGGSALSLAELNPLYSPYYIIYNKRLYYLIKDK